MVKIRRKGRKEEKRREKKENETGTDQRRCVGIVSVEACEILTQGRDLESCGDLSWEDLLDKPEDLSDRESEAWVVVPVVLDVTDVLVSSSSVVTEFCVFFSRSLFSFSKKRAHSCTVAQEEMWFEEPQVKAPPLSRRRMMPPTALQSSCSSFEEDRCGVRETERSLQRRSSTCKRVKV